MLTGSQRVLAVRARCVHGQVAIATSTAPAAARGDEAERPTRNDPHWGPLDIPDEPPEVIIVEGQHGLPEPPSQKPPMWFIQVPAQVSNVDAERMLPPQVPPRHTDHLRYPDNLQAGFELKNPDPYDPAPRVEVAVERNIKIAKDKLPPDAEIVSHVLDVRKILEEP